MTMAGKKSGIWSALKVTFFAAFFAVYGVAYAVALVFRLIRRLWWGGRLLHDTIPCPYCHYGVPLVGRYLCSTPGCGAEYQGFIQKCNICGSGCLWTPCPRCNAAVQVGIRI
jgi:hypothetical protein